MTPPGLSGLDENTAAVAKVLRRLGVATCAQIAAELGVAPAYVSIALRELRAAGRAESAGNTRGTLWRRPSTPKKKTSRRRCAPRG